MAQLLEPQVVGASGRAAELVAELVAEQSVPPTVEGSGDTAQILAELVAQLLVPLAEHIH